MGSNGAGKTTTLRTITGQLRPTAGRVLLDGDDITALPPESLARRGVALVPEGRGMLRDLTVDENLELGAYIVRDKRAVREAFDRAYTTFPILERTPQPARGSVVGRTAADARAGPRPDEQSPAAPRRRGLARSLTDHDRDRLRPAARRSTAPPASRCCSSSRTLSPSTSRTAPSCSRRAASSTRPRAKPSARCRGGCGGRTSAPRGSRPVNRVFAAASALAGATPESERVADAITRGYVVGAVVLMLSTLVVIALATRSGGAPMNVRHWRFLLGVASLAAAIVIGIVGYLKLSLEPAVNRQLPYLASAGMALVFLAVLGGSLLVAEQLRADERRVDELESAIRALADAVAPAIEAPARRTGLGPSGAIVEQAHSK